MSTDLTAWLSQEGSNFLSREQPLLSAGTDVSGWRICAFLARGGTAEVYRVERNGEIAALKIARDTQLPKIADRFNREAEILAQLNSAFFPRFHMSGTWDGHPFLVLELLHPLTLPTQDESVAQLVLDLSKALGELHRLGYVHRDVKPTNILTRNGTTPVLVDLGYARPYTDVLPGANTTLSIQHSRVFALGTPGYAAPEQLIGEDVYPATDVHALGVLIMDCFNGSPPSCWQPLIRRATSSLPSQRPTSMQAFATAVTHRHQVRKWILVVGLALICLGIAYGVRTAIVSSAKLLSEERGRVYVRANAPQDGDGSRAYPFNSISNALEKVPWFGTISVGPGTYIGEIRMISKAINLVSENGPQETFLQAPSNDCASVVVISGKGEGSQISGFTITGGQGSRRPTSISSLLQVPFGGGIACLSSATIHNCRIVGNGIPPTRHFSEGDAPCLGGGVYAGNGTVTLEDCLISNNHAWAAGGGLCAQGSNTFLSLTRCQIITNRTHGFQGRIGGVALVEGARVSLRECILSGNQGKQVDAVGGAYAEGTQLRISNSRIQGGAHPGNTSFFNADPISMEDTP